MRNRILSLLTAIVVALPIFGHSVWIEPTNEGLLIIRFAEPDGRFEKSPGHLDKLSLPGAWISGEKGPITKTVQIESDHFLIAGSDAAKATQLETRFDVMAAPGKPGRLPFFYARWVPDWSQASPALTLDIVPTGKPGEARAFFRGKPLPGINATLRTPDEKEQSLTANDEGFFHFDSKQSGTYMLNIAHHREPLPGFAVGRAYEQTSHNASLTWVQK